MTGGAAPFGRWVVGCPNSLGFMKFRIPGRKVHVRLFEPVETVVKDYKIIDVGLEYSNGGVDSLAVGGAFYTLGKVIGNANAKADDTPESKALDGPNDDVVDTSATSVPDTQQERELVAQS